MSASDKSLRRKDFIKAAQADGFEFARRLDQKEDIQETIKAWLDYPGPAFLEVIIDREACVYPMVGPGLPYSAMITGEFIPNRSGDATDDGVDGSSMF